MKRTKGYVIGSDPLPEGGVIWKVRIQDPESSRNGGKLQVASLHEDIVLAAGLDVNFIVGIKTVDGKKLFVAVDVRLQTEDQE